MWICTRVVFTNVVVVDILQKLAEWQGPLTPNAQEQIVEPPHFHGLEVLVSGHHGPLGVQLYPRKRGLFLLHWGKATSENGGGVFLGLQVAKERSKPCFS